MQTYDDRGDPAFHAVQARLRKRMSILAAVVTLSLILAVAVVAQRGLVFSSPRDLAIVALLVFFSSLDVIAIVLTTRQVYFAVADGSFDYPRWGGILRGRVPLSRISAFRREGRDEAAQSVILFSGQERFLVIPGDYLTDAGRFMEALRQLGVRELPARYRATRE